MDVSEKVTQAHEELMIELFGHVPTKKPSVDRSTYTKAMHRIQEKYSLGRGEPGHLEWVLTLIGQSPKIVDDKEGSEDDGRAETNEG